MTFDLVKSQRAVFRSALSTSQKLVLLAIIDHWSVKCPEPFPGVATLERWTGMKRCSIYRNIKSLEGIGALAVKRATGQPNSYNLDRATDEHLPQYQDTRDTGVPESTSVPDAPVPVSLVHGSSIPKSTLRNPLRNPKKEPKASASALAVYEHWFDALGEPVLGLQPRVRSKPSKSRLEPINARLATGYTASQLCKAIDAVAKSDLPPDWRTPK